MKYIIIPVLFLMSFAVSGKEPHSTAENESKTITKAPVQWELVWEDNFDVAGLPNPKIWGYEVGYIRNKEAQYYTKERTENARIEDGHLIIEARNDNWNNHKITAASINTYGKKSILYGRVEVKAKLPTGVGTWPAIWMLGDAHNEGYIRNNEAQFYTKERMENARVENGNLVIEAKMDNWNGHKITAASINTYGKKSMLYGRIEVKAKLPTGVGTWPAIWMLGDAHNEGTRWPACGEIDIMENVGYEPDVIHANIHTKAYNHVKGTNKGNKITIEKPYENFNVYAVEWFEDHMDFYLNDSLYFSFKNEGTGNDVWPFDKPHYLLINLAIGGGWGGQKGIDEKIFPQKYYIDYVKVYRVK